MFIRELVSNFSGEAREAVCGQVGEGDVIEENCGQKTYSTGEICSPDVLLHCRSGRDRSVLVLYCLSCYIMRTDCRRDFIGIRPECNDFAGRIFDIWALRVDRYGYSAATQLISKEEVVSSITASTAMSAKDIEREEDSGSKKIRIASWNIAGLGMLLEKRKTVVGELKALDVDAGAL